MAVKTDTQLQTQRAEIENETTANANTAARVGQMMEDIIDSKATKEFNRTFSEALVFDKNEIFCAATVMNAAINFTIGEGGLVDQSSGMRVVITTDGINAINFSSGFDFLYGISNGEILPVGTYEMYFLYTNGSVSVNFPGTSSEGSSLVVLSAPGNFDAVPGAGDPETEVDLTWDDVSNESNYEIQYSSTGGSGPWNPLTMPAANATSYTHTGLTPGATYHYRIRSVGDGVNFQTSAWVTDATTTESGGDVTAPTFIFLPASGVTDWTVNQAITLTADEAIRNTDGSEITSANVATRITLKETNSGGANIAFTATIDITKTIITITPTTHYGENQLVYVAINNVEDFNGNEVTIAISSTFTTTDYTFFNGTSNRLAFGDILDSLFAANDSNFWLELTVNDLLLSGSRVLVSKNSQSDNQRSWSWYHLNTDVFFAWFSTGNASNGSIRGVKWAGALSAGEHTLVLKYDGSIDTNEGLDRLTLLVDGGTAGSKTLDLNLGTPITGDPFSNTAQLCVGVMVNNAGTPNPGVGFISGELKDFIVRSTSGSVVEINVANLKLGNDGSGNARNGTWV